MLGHFQHVMLRRVSKASPQNKVYFVSPPVVWSAYDRSGCRPADVEGAWHPERGTRALVRGSRSARSGARRTQGVARSAGYVSAHHSERDPGTACEKNLDHRGTGST